MRRAPAPAATPVDPATLGRYAGAFEDAWRGAATVSLAGDHLELVFSRTDGLKGPLVPVGPGLFIARWEDRSIDADAYVRFSEDFAGKVTGFTMRAVSGTTDFSFDFHDLDFRRKPDRVVGAQR